MHLLNVKAVVNDLRYGTVDNRDSAKYLIGTLLLQSLTILSNGSGDGMPIYYRWGSWAVTAIIIVLGVKSCLTVNTNGDDKEFLKRFFCLALPIGICISIFLFFTSMFLGLLIYWKTSAQSISENKLTMLIPLLLLGFAL